MGIATRADLDRLLLLCRPGFEGDAAAEVLSNWTEAGGYGHARTMEQAGVLECFPGDGRAWDWLLAVPQAGSVFARQLCAAAGRMEDLPASDRLGPLLADWRVPVGDAIVEAPEGDSHRSLSKLAGRLIGPLRGQLQQRGLWKPADPMAPRLHLVLDSGTSAWLGVAPMNVSSPQPGGIPRLRRMGGAPSRSALKLEEALQQLLSPAERYTALKAGDTAVDLGAAPGGWTWVLRQYGLRVAAIDNGDLADSLRHDPEVEHVRADAFTWQPARRVDWLVCDVVDKPARVVETVARWLRRGLARDAVFNLKLPMRRRWQAVVDAEQRFWRILGPQGRHYSLQITQLYHDREEVTCLARRAPGVPGPG